MLKATLPFLTARLGFTRRGAWITFAVFALVFALRAISCLVSPVAYTATTRIGWGDTAVTHTSHADPLFVRTECKILESDAVLGSVLRELDNRRGLATPTPSRLSEGERLAQLRSQLWVKPANEAGDIELGVRAPEQREAAMIAEAWIRIYGAERLPEVGQARGQAGAGEVSFAHMSSPIKVSSLNKLLPLTRQFWGALLIGLTAGFAVSYWLPGSCATPARADIFARVFVVTFCGVLGVSALSSSANLAVGAATGFCVALVGGAIAHWTCAIRRTSFSGRKLIPALSWGVFLLFGVGGWFSYTFMTPMGYWSTALVQLSPDKAGSANRSGLDRQVLDRECERICSKDLLEMVSTRLDLRDLAAGAFAADSRYPGTGVWNKWLDRNSSLAALRQVVRAAPVRGTSLIGITVLDPRPEQAANIANTLAELYRKSRNKSDPETILIYKASPPSASHVINAGPIVAWALWGLICAWVAAGGAIFGVWLATPNGARVRLFVPPSLMGIFLFYISLAFFAPTGLYRPFKNVVQFLLLFLGGTGALYLRARASHLAAKIGERQHDEKKPNYPSPIRGRLK